VSKNPFYTGDNGPPPYLAGYTVGFCSPLIDFLLARGHRVALFSPVSSNVSRQHYHLFPLSPQGLIRLPIEPKRIPKVPYPCTELELKAAILSTDRLMGGIDAALSIYVFPWVMPLADLKRRLHYRLFAFLRGSDLVEGCRADSNYSLLYDSDSGINIWPSMSSMMVRALNTSKKTYATSRFLTNLARQLGVRVSGIFPSVPFKEGKRLRHEKGDKSRFRKHFLREFCSGSFRTVNPDLEWILYLGRVHYEKCIDLVLRALPKTRNLNRMQLIVAGDGPDMNRLRKLSNKLKMKNVAFGFVPPHLVPALCKAATALVQPSLPSRVLDAAPSSCINAAYVGLPIILPHVEGKACGGAGEFVGQTNRQRLSFDPYLPTSNIVKIIAEKIDLIIEDERLREKTAEENVQFTSFLNPDVVLDDLESRLIESIG